MPHATIIHLLLFLSASVGAVTESSFTCFKEDTVEARMHSAEKTWKDAADFCATSGGILCYNETIVEQCVLNLDKKKPPVFVNAATSFWIGNHDEGENIVDLWVEKVLGFSSEYNNNSWGANQVVGSPDVYPHYGDIRGTWAQLYYTDNEFIEVKFAEQLYVTQVDVYETFHSGGVKTIKAHVDDKWLTVWSTESIDVIKSARVLSITVNRESVHLTDTLRIEVNCTKSRAFVEIDAVKISGTRPKQDCKCLNHNKGEEFSYVTADCASKLYFVCQLGVSHSTDNSYEREVTATRVGTWSALKVVIVIAICIATLVLITTIFFVLKQKRTSAKETSNHELCSPWTCTNFVFWKRAKWTPKRELQSFVLPGTFKQKDNNTTKQTSQSADSSVHL